MKSRSRWGHSAGGEKRYAHRTDDAHDILTRNGAIITSGLPKKAVSLHPAGSFLADCVARSLLRLAARDNAHRSTPVEASVRIRRRNHTGGNEP